MSRTATVSRANPRPWLCRSCQSSSPCSHVVPPSHRQSCESLASHEAAFWIPSLSCLWEGTLYAYHPAQPPSVVQIPTLTPPGQPPSVVRTPRPRLRRPRPATVSCANPCPRSQLRSSQAAMVSRVNPGPPRLRRFPGAHLQLCEPRGTAPSPSQASFTANLLREHGAKG